MLCPGAPDEGIDLKLAVGKWFRSIIKVVVADDDLPVVSDTVSLTEAFVPCGMAAKSVQGMARTGMEELRKRFPPCQVSDHTYVLIVSLPPLISLGSIEPWAF